MSNDAPILEVESHIQGKNAQVRVYRDRVEWERQGGVSGAKMTAAVFTVGISLAATGVRGRKGAATEFIPMKSITSVTTRRDSMVNEIVSIITPGNTIDLRCSKRDAEQLKSVILDGIMGRLDVAPVATPAASPAIPAPPSGPPAGWYADPHGTAGLMRYWDGAHWTEHTHQQ